MSLILVRVKRPEAAHHADGKVYKTGEPFMMEEELFRASVPGFFERVEPEQIKSKELPPGEPAHGPATAAVKTPEPPIPGDTSPAIVIQEEPANASTSDPQLGEKKNLKLKKQR